MQALIFPFPLCGGCGGKQDSAYIESVLRACQLAVRAVLVIEQVEEVGVLLQVLRLTGGVSPLLGVRARLSTRHEGHWGATSGEGAKFGLSAPEMLQVVDTLREEGLLDKLHLLHFHIGSQIPSIQVIKEAMREASHLYCELALLGAPMVGGWGGGVDMMGMADLRMADLRNGDTPSPLQGIIDVGGGLGIDYDGGASSLSPNYSMQVGPQPHNHPPSPSLDTSTHENK